MGTGTAAASGPRRSRPWSPIPAPARRVVTDVLAVSALELSHPVPIVILVIANDAPLHGPSLVPAVRCSAAANEEATRSKKPWTRGWKASRAPMGQAAAPVCWVMAALSCVAICCTSGHSGCPALT